MANLGSLVTQMIKKEKLGKETYSPNYRTGIDIMDYRGGRWEGDRKVLGICGGKILSIVGKTGSSKSSYAYKIAGEIIKTHENGQVIHLDYERAGNKTRIAHLAGIDAVDVSANSDKWTFLNSGISSETLYQLVKAIHKIKMDNKEDLIIREEVNGEEVEYFPPTVIIVDSVATMIPDSIIDETELSGQMSASAIARQNNAIFKRITNFITDANITIICINHITKKIEIGMVKTKAELNFLKQDESLPGGSSCYYLSDSNIKLEPGAKLDPSKDYGIKGFTVIGQYIKSRANAAGYQMTLIFDQENGLDNLLTNIQFLKENKLLLGSGHGYYIEPCPDKKFKLKNVRELYYGDDEFREIFDDYIDSIYTEFLSTKPLEEENELEFVNVIDEDLGIYEGNDGLFYRQDEDSNVIQVVKKGKSWADA